MCILKLCKSTFLVVNSCSPICVCVHVRNFYLHRKKRWIVMVMTFFVYLKTIQIHNKILKSNLPPWGNNAPKMK